MFSLKAILFVPLALCALSGVEQQSAARELPKFTVTPVEQDAPWAVDWWRTRHDEKIELARATEVGLLFIGDSITHAWETDGAEVWREYYRRRNGFNLGFSGDRTEHVLWRLANGAVDGMTPKLVVLMIGTNNTGHRMDPPAYTAEGIETIVGDLRRRLPQTRVLVLGIFPRQVSPLNEMRRRNAAINQLIAELDDGKAVHYLDIGPAFLKGDGALRDDLMPDLLHLNAEGYRVWAESMEPTIRRLLGE